MEDLSNYDQLRTDAQALFSSTPVTRSPALGEPVHFTAEGFNHLVFKRARAERDRSSQSLRFKLLPRALDLVGFANTYQEYEETLGQFQVKERKKRVWKTKSVKYWGIIAIRDGRKIKVILRKVGDGQLHFWSVVPAWTTNKYRDLKLFSTMKGNPEED